MLGIRGGRLLVGHFCHCVAVGDVRLALDLAGIILAAAGLGFRPGARPPMAEGER